MSTSLVIVESPAKAKTIRKYLGKGYKVLASYGHVRDLIPKSGAVDTENNFEMNYAIIERNEKHVEKIIKALYDCDALYLAPDPDREGEAIAWHLVELLKERKALVGKKVHRVVFHEITKKAIQAAIQNPKKIDTDMVSAQQARRALDYLVGFNLSPLLWKKIRPKLSAGRVQSPALRLIVEREDEIEKFEPQEYWSIAADVETQKQPFNARLTQYKSDKVEQFSFTDEASAMDVQKTVTQAADGKLSVVEVDKRQRKRNPAPPFITSTLQQEASRKLGFSANRTMRTAQKLYEGMDVGDGQTGLITYMRTDSVTLAQEAVTDIRYVIEKRYGKDNVPAEARVFKTKSKNAQEAHEAIRPTSAARIPEEIKQYLEPDQYKLYNLIWKRTVASQMVEAIFDTVKVEMEPAKDAGGHRLRANGSILKEPGFMAVYIEDQDDKKGDSGDDKLLPDIAKGDVIDLLEIVPTQHFTEPPPRYTEASLVKVLEEYGIGRPSTYASIIYTLISREYVEMDGRRFMSTHIGKIVSRFLTAHFDRWVDYGYTADLEDRLDAVARGERDWVKLLEDFWTLFKERVDFKEETVTRDEAAATREIGVDPESGKPVFVKIGRYGPYVQIGTKDDEEKPKFAGLLPDQHMDKITYDEAMRLFELPRDLGETPEGEPMSSNYGRFGPYIKYGSLYASIKKAVLDEGIDPFNITPEKALEIVEEKKEADRNKLIQDFPEEGIQVLNGHYGPYVTNKEVNAKVPKDTDPKSLNIEQCLEMIAIAEKLPRNKKRLAAKKKKAAKNKKAKKKTTKKKTKKKTTKKKSTKKKTTKKKVAKKKT